MGGRTCNKGLNIEFLRGTMRDKFKSLSVSNIYIFCTYGNPPGSEKTLNY